MKKPRKYKNKLKIPMYSLVSILGIVIVMYFISDLITRVILALMILLAFYNFLDSIVSCYLVYDNKVVLRKLLKSYQIEYDSVKAVYPHISKSWHGDSIIIESPNSQIAITDFIENSRSLKIHVIKNISEQSDVNIQQAVIDMISKKNR